MKKLKMKAKNNILVFGAFDGLHKGHLEFLKSAKTLGDHLTVCLAKDSIIETLKNKQPKYSFLQRKQNLESLPEVDAVIEGDEVLGTYSCLSVASPSIVALGYDQEELKNDLETYIKDTSLDTQIVMLEAYQPHIYKSSLLN